MLQTPVWTLLPALVFACWLAVELVLRMPLLSVMERMGEYSLKALALVRSSAISDHWKEKALPAYARQILKFSLLLAGLIILALAAFTVSFVFFAWWPSGSLAQALDSLLRIEVQALALLIGAAIAWIRSRIAGKPQSSSDYSASSQSLHRLALGSRAVKIFSNDLDEMSASSQVSQCKIHQPVFVAGLARAGTTIVLEALYASENFVSLTYRSMPFVLAPWTWGRFSKPANDASAGKNKRERAHGDRLRVGIDSPEAFEEVFWSTIGQPESDSAQGLKPAGRPDPERLERFRSYVKRVVARDAVGRNYSRRYLSKNNNNLLRLEWLSSAFEDAIIITPFRNPVHHVDSLMRQHRRFLERHETDPFSLQYMNWLGHYEFGQNFRPFLVSDNAVPRGDSDLLEPEYWINYWESVYRYILENQCDRVIWLDYDQLCEDPEQSLRRLETTLGLPAGSLVAYAEHISHSGRRPDLKISQCMTNSAELLYEHLREKATHSQ